MGEIRQKTSLGLGPMPGFVRSRIADAQYCSTQIDFGNLFLVNTV
jgi:hypothetical protein